MYEAQSEAQLEETQAAQKALSEAITEIEVSPYRTQQLSLDSNILSLSPVCRVHIAPEIPGKLLAFIEKTFFQHSGKTLKNLLFNLILPENS